MEIDGRQVETVTVLQAKELLRSVKREGIKELMEWLDTTDFYSAPASTKYHGAKYQGLIEHSVSVYEILCSLRQAFPNDFEGIPDESLIIAALLHDLCKIDMYVKGTRNVKNDRGQWESVPCWEINEKFIFGHGEKSAYLAADYIDLTEEELYAIRWHMGPYSIGGREFATESNINKVFDNHALAMYLYTADMLAAHRMKL